ncbi:MAG: diguanylate cyclase (GGDEF)-like protein [Gammaproteobacteria bacterium]|jgi:diguanylate cyclase (GGDEF)-like protein
MTDGDGHSVSSSTAIEDRSRTQSADWLKVQLRPENATILIVDDEPAIIEIARLYLEDAGYRHFVTTTDPTQALTLIEESAPDAVLLDVLMPGLSGLEILASIRATARPSPLPVLVLTSATDASTKQNALELGASDFLAKPVDPSELTLRLRNVLTAKAYQDRLAYVDEVTGLPNRRHFLERLRRTVVRTQRANCVCALLHIGLDRFQTVNDALGYKETETLLRDIAERIDLNLRPGDVLGNDSPQAGDGALSRVESDEFMVLLSDLGSIEAVPDIAARVLDAIDHPFVCAGHELRLSASVGVVFSPLDGDDPEVLMTHASRSMNYARENGGGAVQFYSDEIQSWTLERMQLEADLRKAISDDALELHYQPKIDLANGRIYGVEALMRWTHPQRGAVSPVTFIPVAEEAGLIESMGAWALRKACAQAADWDRSGLPAMNVAVNVSSRQLDGDALRGVVQEALSLSRLPAERLTLELTEGSIMTDPDHSVRLFESLKALGLKISVDDFGTGYSSLGYLKRLPVDELKIDRSFVMDIPDDKDDMAIVKAVIALAHGLGLSVVAEGVETQEQLRFLTGEKCGSCQGFLFSRPVPAADIEVMLRASPTFASSVRTNAA